MRSQPLNVVYNPDVYRRVTDFLRLPDDQVGLQADTRLNDELYSAALSQIEAAKKRTKEKLVKNLNYLWGGGNDPLSAKKIVWDVSVQLSAPQVLVPEHFVDKEALIMVVDLGKFHLTNVDDNCGAEDINLARKGPPVFATQNDEEEVDEEEVFVTPPSSLASSVADEPISKPGNLANLPALEYVDPSAVRHNDRFRMSMAGMRVIVGRAKDNWGRYERSFEVLLAHLGAITVHNEPNDGKHTSIWIMLT